MPCPEAGSAPARPLRFGPSWDGASHTTFRLWAPSIDTVSLQLEHDQSRHLMQREAEGWFELRCDCGPGTAYRFVLPAGTLVPDPASRAQVSDIDSASLVVDPDAYQWQYANWRGRPWPEAVIYELHLGVLGGFEAAAERLPALAALGITVVELMPVAEFAGHRNWGYDGVLPFAPEASYGSPEQLKAFVDAAHGVGLCVMLDVVYNHFGPAGNHLADYAASFFKTDQASAWGAAINFDQPAVREFFISNALYWLSEYRFDGLRLDAVHAIGSSAFLRELAVSVRTTFEPERHVHLVIENEHNDASLLEPTADGSYFDAQWNDDFHNALHVVLTGEHESYYGNYCIDPVEQLLRCLSEGFAYQGEPMPMQEGKRRGSPSAHLPTTAFVNFLQNHDQIGNRAFGERLTTLIEPAALRAAQALLLLSPAIPLFFMGEEDDSETPFLFFTDFEQPLAGTVLEGRSKEFAGFSAFAGDSTAPAIPDPNARSTFEHSVPMPAATAMERASTIKSLLSIRQRELVPHLANTRSASTGRIGEKAFCVEWTLGDASRLRIACNLGGKPLALSPLKEAAVIFETAAAEAGGRPAGTLPAYSTIVELLRAA